MRLAIILARGGSKRIPRKNYRLFCGKPMIYWAIKSAKDSKLFDNHFKLLDTIFPNPEIKKSYLSYLIII